MNLNFVVFVGRSGGVPKVNFTPNGTKYATFFLAVNDARLVKSEWVVDTMWLKVKGWGHMADIIEAHVLKGDLVLVQGSLKIEKYTGKDDKVYTVVCVNAHKLQVLKPTATDTSHEYIEAPTSSNQQQQDDEVPF